MDYAVALYFDSQGEAKVQYLVDQLIAAGLNRMYRDTGMRPHITIAQIDTDDDAGIEQTVRALSNKLEGLSLTLGSTGFFARDEGVVYLAPIMSEPLLHLHAKIQHALKPHAHTFSPLYLPDRWVPHCTLALELVARDMKVSFEVLAREFNPIEARIEQLGLIRCCPYQEHLTCQLKA